MARSHNPASIPSQSGLSRRQLLAASAASALALTCSETETPKPAAGGMGGTAGMGSGGSSGADAAAGGIPDAAARDAAASADLGRDTASTAAALPAGTIDTHIHYWDPARPEGSPWPAPTETALRKTAMPADYLALAKPLGVAGVVVVEAVWRLLDHDWMFDIAKNDPTIVAVVGSVSGMGTDVFATNLKKLAENKLFRGIRGDAGRANMSAETMAHADLLADLDLTLDVNPSASGLMAVAALAKAKPKLRIVLNHMANVPITGMEPPMAWMDGLSMLGGLPNVWCKGSYLVEGARSAQALKDGGAVTMLDHYRMVLDHVWKVFGDDKVIFGSNWPVCEPAANLETVVRLVREYTFGRGATAAEKYFVKNPKAAYKIG